MKWQIIEVMRKTDQNYINYIKQPSVFREKKFTKIYKIFLLVLKLKGKLVFLILLG
jgi:hypothetical protein